MLEAGSVLPDIALEDSNGGPVNLQDFRGRANVLMYFMRSTTCPVCNSHVQNLVDHKADFAADNVTVLVAVPEGRDEAAAWQLKRQLPFTVVTGRQGTPHESIGLTKKVFGTLQQSGSVLIDRDEVVRHAHGASIPVGSYDKNGVAHAIADLATVRP